MLSAYYMPLRSVPTHFSEDVSAAGQPLHPDRRKRARVPVEWPVVFSDGHGSVIEAVTHDLSSNGFYCLASRPFVPGEVRICTLSLPANHPDDLSLVMPVQCRVRVLRVEALAERDLFGVSCRIDDYWVHQPPAAADPVRECERAHAANSANTYS